MAGTNMPAMLWSLYFIQSQGYELECVGLYQDNVSTQLIMKNSRFSSRKKAKHIKAKAFFIKDRIDYGDIKVIKFPAEEMWVDVLTKPLQGMAFRTMRAQLMNCTVRYKDEKEKIELKPAHQDLVTWKDTKPSALQSLQECVGNDRLNQKIPTTDRRF